MLGLRVAILVQQDPDDPSNSRVFWAIAGLLVVFLVVVVTARLL
jgi:hypothetical protein